MPSYYEAVGDEPTYALAEGIIKATIYKLKIDSNFYNTYPSSAIYLESYLEVLGYRFISTVHNNDKDITAAIHLIIQHFPDVLKIRDNALYIKESSKHLLNANDLLIMDYYMLLLNQYEERVKEYQWYLKKQQDRQQYKLLFVVALPFIILILMILVGD